MNSKTMAVAAALCLFLAPAHAQQGDKLLQTMKHELEYNFAELQKQDIKPYFMSYRAEDTYQNMITSSFGVLQDDQESHSRIVTPQVRVGDMQLDNFKYFNQGMPQQGRQAATVTIPFDDDSPAIATNIWAATISRYRMAQTIYQQTQSRAATSAADEDKAPCFSKAPVETYYEAPLPVSQTRIDRKAWEERLNAVSAVFKAEPSLQTGAASLNFSVTRTWLVNTEGTSVVQNRVTARVVLQVQVQADDGMQLPLMTDFFAFSPDSLPSQGVMVDAAKDLTKRVMALKNAPVANPYTGPAILSGPASGVFFHEIFGHRLEGHRLKQGGETFRKMVGKEVLPTTFQVFSDPTLRKYHGQDMNGHYLYDSEGVKARRVDNVVDGVLKEFLMSRVPLDGFPQSNGHGRAAGANDAVSRQSNLCVETTKPVSETRLRAELREECRKQDKEYGYYFKTVTSGYTMTGEQGSINSFNVTPVEVYRVYVDGRPDELVRGVSLIGTPLSMFSHIKYGGDTPSTFTGVCGAESGWVPVTANSPAIFVTQIETQRVNKTQGIPPVLPAPTFVSPLDNGASEAEIIQRAMQDELQRSFDSLQIAGAPRPFWVSYMVNRHRSASVVGELGGISQCAATPWQTSVTAHLPLGNFRSCSDMMQQPVILGGRATSQVDYGLLRRTFWSLSDGAYKNSINILAQKNNYLLQHPLPASLAKIPNMQHAAPITYAEPQLTFAEDTARFQNIAKTLSAIFNDYPQLFNTQVSIHTSELQTYRLTTERVSLAMPHNRVTIQADAQFQDDNQVLLADKLTLNYESVDEIPDIETLKGLVRKFADDCMAMRNAPELEDAYKGPVMYDEEASFRVFSSYLRPNGFFAQPAIQEAKNSLGEKLDKKIMDERITIRNLTAQADWNGTPLFGHYSVDADGFKPQPEMTIVDKGVFKMMLNRATPAQYAEKSTGSARFGNDPNNGVPQVGVGTLCITADKATDEEKMVKSLVKVAKKKKLEYAYILVAPVNYTNLRLYQINVKTGERKLVKTNNVAMPNKDQMQEMLDISAESLVKNLVAPYTYSVVYPKSIIVDNVELPKSSFLPVPVDPIPYPLLRGEHK